MELQFNSIIDDVKELVGGKTDGENVFQISVGRGIIYTNAQEIDRTIVSYSYNSAPEYDFEVSGLDNNDNYFDIDISDVNQGSIKIYNVTSDPERFYEVELSIALPTIDTTFNLNFSGRACIYLNDTNLPAGEENFGKIWLFDSNSIKYLLETNEKTYELSLEKGGIIYTESGTSSVKRPFNTLYEENYFGINVLQIIALQSASAGGDDFKININADSTGTWMQERGIVYNLRLQFHGDNAIIWLDNIFKKYLNTFTLSDNTLFLDDSAPASGGVDFSFLNSVINIEMY